MPKRTASGERTTVNGSRLTTSYGESARVSANASTAARRLPPAYAGRLQIAAMTAAASARSSSGAHCEQLLSSELSALSGGTPRGCVPISLSRLARQMAYEVKWDGFRAIVSTEGRCAFGAAAAGI
jgi:ATP-dependent DNA ligase